MNLRCMYCQTMFGISRENMLIGLQAMEEAKLDYFEFHCPKCRRANRVERKKLELANPNWQETVKALAKEAAKAEKDAAKEEKPVSKMATTPPAKEKKPATKSKAAPKASAKKSTAKASPKGKAKSK